MPTLSCVDLSEDVTGAVNVTVSWTVNGKKSANFYFINIATNAPQTPYGGFPNITTASVTQYELTGFMTGYEYNITVVCVIVKHGSEKWIESEPLTIRPQGKQVLNKYTCTQCMFSCMCYLELKQIVLQHSSWYVM